MQEPEILYIKNQIFSTGKKSPRMHEWTKAIEESGLEYSIATLLDCKQMACPYSIIFAGDKMAIINIIRRKKKSVASITCIKAGIIIDG